MEAGSQRVLLVEDDNASQLLEGVVLAHLGLEVDLASNGAEALEFLSRKDYALVLMDCVMPVMGGIEATRQICDGSARSPRWQTRNPLASSRGPVAAGLTMLSALAHSR